jgi:hypothetical protein
VIVELDDDGRARTQINTQFLETGRASIEVSRGDDLSVRAENEIKLRITDREIIIREPQVVAIGDTFTITGSARGAEIVKEYALIDGRWEPLFADAARGRFAGERIRQDGRFQVEIDTGRVINVPGSYRIGLALDATDTYASDQRLTTREFGALVTATTATRTYTGGLSGTVSRRTVVAGSGDEVILSGTAIGQGDILHLYVIGPRGSIVVADTVNVRRTRFEQSLDEFDRRGTYQVLVAGQGRDARFNIDNTPRQVRDQLPEDFDQQQAVELLRDVYSGAGVDDRIVQLSIVATSSSITINPVGVDDFITHPADQVILAGQSNREPGTEVTVSVRRADRGDAVASASAQVETDGEWLTSADVSGVEPGLYTVEADDGEATVRRTFTVGPVETSIATPTETPTAASTKTLTETATSAIDTTRTSPITTAPGVPGFGPTAVGAAIILLVSVLFIRQRDRR